MNEKNEIIKQEVIGESRLIQGECLAVMDKLIAEGIVVDAIITDPPYWMELQLVNGIALFLLIKCGKD